PEATADLLRITQERPPRAELGEARALLHEGEHVLQIQKELVTGIATERCESGEPCRKPGMQLPCGLRRAPGVGSARGSALDGNVGVLDEASGETAQPVGADARREDALQRRVLPGRLIRDVALPCLLEQEALTGGVRNGEARIDACLDGTPPQERRREGVDRLDRRLVDRAARALEASRGCRVSGRARSDLLDPLLDPGPYALRQL